MGQVIQLFPSAASASGPSLAPRKPKSPRPKASRVKRQVRTSSQRATVQTANPEDTDLLGQSGWLHLTYRGKRPVSAQFDCDDNDILSVEIDIETAHELNGHMVILDTGGVGWLFDCADADEDEDDDDIDESHPFHAGMER